MSVKRNERMRRLLTLLHDRGRLDAAALCSELVISPATLRRDLTDLEDQGLLVRTHGGARAIDPTKSEIPVRLRDHLGVAAKRRIAQHAAALIPFGPHVVALTGGVTTAEVAKALKGHADLTIVTNSLSLAVDCAVDAHMKVIMTGGRVRANSLEAVGPLAEATIEAVNVGTAILGADGMSADNGATTFDETEARAAAAMAARAQRVVVAVDGTKIGKVNLAKMIGLAEIDDLVTDAGADPIELDKIAASGVRIRVVGTPSRDDVVED
ncbi:DeoR/GlpR family DNA-binding transcription regulator [soil metagenome]